MLFPSEALDPANREMGPVIVHTAPVIVGEYGTKVLLLGRFFGNHLLAIIKTTMHLTIVY